MTALLALGLTLAFWAVVLFVLVLELAWHGWKGLLRGSGRAWRDEEERW